MHFEALRKETLEMAAVGPLTAKYLAKARVSINAALNLSVSRTKPVVLCSHSSRTRDVDVATDCDQVTHSHKVNMTTQN